MIVSGTFSVIGHVCDGNVQCLWFNLYWATHICYFVDRENHSLCSEVFGVDPEHPFLVFNFLAKGEPIGRV
jgi:hypothetical protein